MMKMILNKSNLIAVIIMCLLLSFCLTACAKKDGESELMTEENYIYFLDNEGSRIEGVAYSTDESLSSTEQINAILKALEQEPADSGLKRTLGIQTRVKNFYMKGNELVLDFDEDYLKLGKSEEVLFRAAMVKSLSQLPEVETVLFIVGSSPLTDSKGREIGAMMADSFVDNPGDDINAYDRTEILLYFSNMAGDGLVSEKRTVVYSTNISMEKLLMEELLKGPQVSGHRATLSSDRKLNSVTVKQGVCYVDFSEPVIDLTGAVNEEISVYSVVDTLMEIPEINYVSISIDGSSDRNFRTGVSLGQRFERNLDIIEKGR